MTEGDYGYKIDQLTAMKEAELMPDPIGGWGITVSCKWANLRSVNIDADAVQCLIDHYKKLNEGSIENDNR